MKLIFATHNPNKLAEIQTLLPTYEVASLFDLNFKEEIDETGHTLEANALIKAQAIHNRFQEAVFADDTGLEVEVLDGAPGVYSARYAGEPANAERNMEKLLQALAGEKNRKARFRTVIAYISQAGKNHFFEGSVEGEITLSHSGTQGFGYDPIFKPTGFNQTFAEMQAAQKNEISHRGRAIQKFIQFLQLQKS